jgi:hypothetical protein
MAKGKAPQIVPLSVAELEADLSKMALLARKNAQV